MVHMAKTISNRAGKGSRHFALEEGGDPNIHPPHRRGKSLTPLFSLPCWPEDAVFALAVGDDKFWVCDPYTVRDSNCKMGFVSRSPLLETVST